MSIVARPRGAWPRGSPRSPRPRTAPRARRGGSTWVEPPSPGSRPVLDVSLGRPGSGVGLVEVVWWADLCGLGLRDRVAAGTAQAPDAEDEQQRDPEQQEAAPPVHAGRQRTTGQARHGATLTSAASRFAVPHRGPVTSRADFWRPPAGRPSRGRGMTTMSDLHDPILAWYDEHARDLPWRAPAATPWSVMVSEFMLQQTPVDRVLPVHEAWLRPGRRRRRSPRSPVARRSGPGAGWATHDARCGCTRRP